MPNRETLIFYSNYQSYEPWRDALQAVMPELDVRNATDMLDAANVQYALISSPPPGFFDRFRDLRLLVNLGAGVDALMSRSDVPKIPITRIADAGMSRMMSQYVLFAVLRYARDIPEIEAAQRQRHWLVIPARESHEISVGILGLGELGAFTAKALVAQGFDVHGWSRTPKNITGVKCTSGAGALPAFLADLDIVVVLLPLTPDTRGMLGIEFFGALPKGAKIINAARGALIDEKALISALQSGRLGGATLDTFEREPLPKDHPLWITPNVLITPHQASRPIPTAAAGEIVENIRRIKVGKQPLHLVEPVQGY
jgi:glyoxylate/hydroxypyruvate reductase A